jgi:hypothetical protein
MNRKGSASASHEQEGATRKSKEKRHQSPWFVPEKLLPETDPNPGKFTPQTRTGKRGK